jgi:chromosome segregation ATPase
MVEALVYGGLGFLVACLIFLAIGRMLWLRAVRLTTRRLIDRLPMSRADIVAEQDFVRAEAAVQARAMQRQTARLQGEIAAARIEIGRRDAELAQLRCDLAAGVTGAAAIEMLRANNDELKIDSATARMAQAAAETARDAAMAKLRRAEAELAELNAAFDAQRVEIAALRTDVANAENAVLSRVREKAAAAEAAAAERERALQGRVAVLEAALAQQPLEDPAVAADRAALRDRIEVLAAEITRLSSVAIRRPRTRTPRRGGSSPATVEVVAGNG